MTDFLSKEIQRDINLIAISLQINKYNKLSMKKVSSLSLILLFATHFFALGQEYLIKKELYQPSCIAYEVTTEKYNTKKYELKEVDNPKYVAIKTEIDSMETLLNQIQKRQSVYYDSINTVMDQVNNKILPVIKLNNLIAGKSFLEKAIQESEKKKSLSDKVNDLSYEKDKWEHLKYAKAKLIESQIQFEQNTSGKFKVAIEQANNNLIIIDELLENNENNKLKLKELRLLQSQATPYTDEINNLLSKINLKKDEIRSRGTSISHAIPEKTYDHVPIGDLTREILLVGEKNIASELEGKGSFTKESTIYRLFERNHLQYKKGEIITIKEARAGHRFDSLMEATKQIDGYLFKNVSTGNMYLSEGDILKICGIDKDFDEVSSFLKKNGGNMYPDDEDNFYWVSYQGYKCKFDLLRTPLVIKNLKNGDASIIVKMGKSVALHKNYKLQAEVLAQKMTKYYNSYIAQTINSSGLSAWKSSTIQCDALLIKMRNLPLANEREYYMQTSEHDNSGIPTNDIIDVNTVSKKLLGL